MKKIVIDTNILIDYVNGYSKWLGSFLKASESKVDLILPTIVIAEYFTSLSLEKKGEQKIADKTFAFFKKQDLTEEIAKTSAKLLRHKSYPQGANLGDLIIASTAIFLKAPLATNNKSDFSKIPHLRLFDPKKLKI